MHERDLGYWTDLLVRRRTIALQVAVAVFGLVLIGTMLWPPAYESTAKILVQDQREQYLVSPDLQEDPMAKQAVAAQPVTEEELNSELELLTSTHLIKLALANLPAPVGSSGGTLFNIAGGIMALPSLGYDTLHHAPEMSARDRWALKLERNLHPSVIKLSNVIEVNFRSHDPRWCQAFLSRLLDQYLEFHAGLTHDPQAEKFFQQQAETLKAKLDGSEDKLRQFEVSNGITDLPAQKQALVSRLSDLQIQASHSAADLSSAQQQVSSIGAQLRTTPERISKETRSVQDQALQGLKLEVMQLKSQRADLLSRYQPTSQRIQEIDAKLGAAQRVLDSENHLEVKEQATDLNPIWVTLDTNLEQSKTNAAAFQATQATLAKEIQQGRDSLTQITNNGVALDRLQRQVAADKEAYLSYSRKSEEARTAQALNLSKILNVSVAQPPTFPLEPVAPRVWLNLVAGLILAAVFGLGAAYWEEQRDERIYSAATISEVSGLPTLAVFRDEA